VVCGKQVQGAAYGCFKQADHQTCLAHLLRRSGEMLETATRGAVRFPRASKRCCKARWRCGIVATPRR
jgi:hypothetical protein